MPAQGKSIWLLLKLTAGPALQFVLAGSRQSRIAPHDQRRSMSAPGQMLLLWVPGLGRIMALSGICGGDEVGLERPAGGSGDQDRRLQMTRNVENACDGDRASFAGVHSDARVSRAVRDGRVTYTVRRRIGCVGYNIGGQVVYDGWCRYGDDAWTYLVKATKTDCDRLPITSPRRQPGVSGVCPASVARPSGKTASAKRRRLPTPMPRYARQCNGSMQRTWVKQVIWGLYNYRGTWPTTD